MAEKYTYRAGDIDVWVRQDGTAIPYYDVEDELNRLAAENAALRESVSRYEAALERANRYGREQDIELAALRELYGAAKEECARGRSKGSALDIGDTGKALWGAYHAAVRSHEAARHKHAEVIKERSR